jgi:hypothetical protein
VNYNSINSIYVYFILESIELFINIINFLLDPIKIEPSDTVLSNKVETPVIACISFEGEYFGSAP